MPPPEYFQQVRKICDKYDVLFIADEVIMGLGRTGKNFGIQHSEIEPDLKGCEPEWRSRVGGLRLSPSYWADRGGMDGFFIAKLVRKG